MIESEILEYLNSQPRPFFRAEWLIPVAFLLAGALWLWWGQSIRPFAVSLYAYPWEIR